MAAMAIQEALIAVPVERWSRVPVLLCLAEVERHGPPAQGARIMDLVSDRLGQALQLTGVIKAGRVGFAVAVAQARELLHAQSLDNVLIVSVDSLLAWPVLSRLDRSGRLLTASNANGFMPGEGAGAILLRRADGSANELLCLGVGFGRELAHLETDAPLRGDGLTTAIKAALSDGDLDMHDVDFRITDNSGEQYFFREGVLALSRTLRQRKESFDIWHPAESIGEVGAASGAVIFALAKLAYEKAYAVGPTALVHLSNDRHERAALLLRHTSLT
jgi:3-oxoacyl-[acyl-carrier-protein] synthase-1